MVTKISLATMSFLWIHHKKFPPDASINLLVQQMHWLLKQFLLLANCSELNLEVFPNLSFRNLGLLMFQKDMTFKIHSYPYLILATGACCF